MQIITDSGEII